MSKNNKYSLYSNTSDLVLHVSRHIQFVEIYAYQKKVKTIVLGWSEYLVVEL
jgi:hypothetical protein